MPPLPEGLLIELVTPLTPTGSLDQDSLGRLLARVAPMASALVAGSPGVGEALELPPAVRFELFTALLSLAPPTLPLFFGITGATPEETEDLARQLEELLRERSGDRPVFWLDLPLWWHSNRGLPRAYLNLCRHLNQPLVLMNHPHLIRGKAKPLKHVNIRTAVFKKLTSDPKLTALIYRGEMRRFLHYYAAMAARPEFMLYEADEHRFLTRPGARGLVSAGAQLFPGTWRQVARACLFPEETGELGKQRRLIWEWSHLLARLEELYQLYPAGLLKVGLHHLGVIAHPTPWPSTPAFPTRLGEQLLNFLDQVQPELPAQ